MIRSWNELYLKDGGDWSVSAREFHTEQSWVTVSITVSDQGREQTSLKLTFDSYEQAYKFWLDIKEALENRNVIIRKEEK